MGVEEDNCTFSCDPGYMLQGSVTSGTCENTGSWSGGLPSCVPLNCSEYNSVNAVVLQSPSCGLAYQSQCTVSCNEGFTGGNVTYLCNVTSDPTMVDWVLVRGLSTITCERGLLYVKMLPHGVLFYYLIQCCDLIFNESLILNVYASLPITICIKSFLIPYLVLHTYIAFNIALLTPYNINYTVYI